MEEKKELNSETDSNDFSQGNAEEGIVYEEGPFLDAEKNNSAPKNEAMKKENAAFTLNISAKTVLGLIIIAVVAWNTVSVFSLGQQINELNQAVLAKNNKAPLADEQINVPTGTGNTGNNPAQPAPIAASPDDDAVLGSADAPVTIIEFSDYQCPYCERFFSGTLPQLKEKYIDTGKAKLVYRDYPLEFHPFAQKAAEAAECAKEQGKYWEMHDKIFENQNALAVDNLKDYAKQIGLDSTVFSACIDSGKTANEVKKDLADGQSYGVSGTPTFFINGTEIVGAQPFSAFQQAIDAELAKKGLN